MLSAHDTITLHTPSVISFRYSFFLSTSSSSSSSLHYLFSIDAVRQSNCCRCSVRVWHGKEENGMVQGDRSTQIWQVTTRPPNDNNVKRWEWERGDGKERERDWKNGKWFVFVVPVVWLLRILHNNVTPAIWVLLAFIFTDSHHITFGPGTECYCSQCSHWAAYPTYKRKAWRNIQSEYKWDLIRSYVHL